MLPYHHRLSKRSRHLQDVGVDTSNVAANSILAQTSAGQFAFQSNTLFGTDVQTSNGCVGIGEDVLQNAGATPGPDAVCLGKIAGQNGVGEDTVLIGKASGLGGAATPSDTAASASTQSIYIGDNAAVGTGTFENRSIALGHASAYNGAGLDSIALGTFSRARTRGSIAIGPNAETDTGEFAVALGDSTISRGIESIAIGLSAETNNAHGVAIGPLVKANANSAVSLGCSFNAPPFANSTSKEGIGQASIALGASANGNATTAATQGAFSVMIGPAACYAGTSQDVVAVGKAAGAQVAPGGGAVLLGADAGQGDAVGGTGAGANSVCIGFQAGSTGSGDNSVLLGSSAKGLNSGCIVLNATGTDLFTAANDSFYVKPIGTSTNTSGSVRPPSDSNFSHYLAYNPTTGEIKAISV